MLYAQLPSKYKKKMNINFELSLTPKLKIENENINPTVYEKIEIIEKYFINENLVDFNRPIDSNETFNIQMNEYVLESCEATKIEFPYIEFELPNDKIQKFSLWVSNPSKIIFDEEKIIQEGTFLYLPEVWIDSGYYHRTVSGCSALKFLVNALTESKLFERDSIGNELFGRDSNKHPIDKLLKLGCEVKYQKRITTLYKKRYITDEQCYIFNNKNIRVNDLMGYPIYIY